MHVFDDLKAPSVELAAYLALYDIVLPKHRLDYYVELIEDKVLNKEPIIRYLEDLIDVIKKKETTAVIKNVFLAWKRNHPDVPEEEAFIQFSIHNEYQKQKRFDKKEFLLKRKIEIQKKKDDKSKSQELLANHIQIDKSKPFALIDLDNFIITEYKNCYDAAEVIGIKSPQTLYAYAKNGHVIREKYLVKLF